MIPLVGAQNPGLRMTYEHQIWLLEMVGTLRLHPRVAKLRCRTPEQEWEILDRMVSEELKLREGQEEADPG